MNKFRRIQQLSDAETESDFFSRLSHYDEELDHTILDKLYCEILELPKHEELEEKVAQHKELLHRYLAQLKRLGGELTDYLEEYRLLLRFKKQYEKGLRGKQLLAEVFGLKPYKNQPISRHDG